MLYAHFGPHGPWSCSNHEERAARFQGWLTNRFDLNEAQQHKLESILDELLEKRTEMRELRLNTREEIISILRDENIDRSRLEQLAAEHQQKINDLISLVGSRITEFTTLLSKEQRESIAQMIEDHPPCVH
jgi:Spy/CpxP family protein refolding chaperone